MTEAGELREQAPRYGLSGAMHQGFLYLKGIYSLLRRPTSRETFVALSEAVVRFRANQDAIRHMLSDPDVAELCRERYVGRAYDPRELVRYPPGSLGHELAAAMIAHGYDPEFYKDFYGDSTPRFATDEEYLRFRVRQMHDIVHVITGFGMVDFPEELGMQAFLAAQTRRPFSIALVGFGLIRIVLQPRELSRTLEQVAKGLTMGYAAKALLGQRFEDDWSKPVEQWRRELGVTFESSVVLQRTSQASARSPGTNRATS